MSRPNLFSGAYGAAKPTLLWYGNQNMTAGIFSATELKKKPMMVTATETQKRSGLGKQGGNFENGSLAGFSGTAVPLMQNRTRSRIEQEVRRTVPHPFVLSCAFFSLAICIL